MIDISKFITKSGGKFFTVTFVKNNGEVRKLNGRLGVKNAPMKKGNYFLVYDVQALGYRMVASDKIISLTCEGVTVLNNRVS
jgi:hypothetical protein